MNYVGAYIQYWRINLMTMVEYRTNFFLWGGFTIVYHGTALGALWVTLYRFPSLNGWDFRETAFLYGLWMLGHAVNNTFFFSIGAVARWYLHQANGVVVRQAVDMLGLPADRVPISVGRYGNTSAASTLILLDEDRRSGRVNHGDLVAFLWVGAGNGAMNGYAAMLL